MPTVLETAAGRFLLAGGSGRKALALAILAGAYYGAARLGLVFEVETGGVAAAWPPSGLVLGVVLAMPRRTWPAILVTVALTNAVAHLAVGHPWSYTLGFSLVDALEGGLAGGLVVWALGRSPSLSRLGDVAAIVVAGAGAANAVTALAGAAVAVSASSASFGETWFTWWMSNGIGMLLVAPPVLAVLGGGAALPKTRRERTELAALFVLLVTAAAWIFSQRNGGASLVPFPYLTFPALLCAALRFGPFFASLASLTISVIAAWHTTRGTGPFALDQVAELLALQAFLSVAAVSALVVAAVLQERRRAEESLGAYQKFTEHAADAILFIRASDCQILDANPAARAAYGYTLEELRGMRLQALTTPESADGVAGRVARADREGLLFETVHRRRDGTPFPIEVHANGVTLRGERVVVSVHRDLTARKQAEAAETAAREAEEASARAERRFRAVFESARDAILLYEEGRIVEANRRAEDLFGLPHEALIGLTAVDLSPELQPGGQPSATLARERVEEALAGPVQSFEWTHKRADGRLVETEVGLTRLDLEGRRLLVGIVRDVSERRGLENQLRQAQKMEAVGRLAGGVAHDFNNLLTVIKGYTELALAEAGGDATRREPLEEVYKAADRASGLTRQLLAFSRKQILQPVVLDPNAVVADMDRMLRRLIGEDIELITLVPHGVWPIFADRGQVEQVLLNLALNARDAMPDGGQMTIETANREVDEAYARQADIVPGPYVVLSVSDTGVGIAPEVRPHIFEPFFTTKERGKGTGLGLSMVYGVVRQSGGHVTFSSEPGRGATFRVYLPAASRAEPLAAGATPLAETYHGHETILLVEDDAGVRRLAQRLLVRWGYRVIVAPGGPEAVEVSRAEAGAIDLLLTDVVMPRMGGRELAQQLAQERPGLRVLFMSGYAEDAVVHHGVLDPGVSLIQKPFTPEAFGRKVREVLDGTEVGGVE